MQAFPERAIRFMWIVSLVGIAVVAVLIGSVPSDAWRWGPIVFFALVIGIVEFFPVSLPNSSVHVSMSFPISYAAVIVLGPAQGTASLLIGGLAANLIIRGRSIRDLYLFFLHNLSSLGLGSGVAGVVYLCAAGTPILQGIARGLSSADLSPAGVVAGAAAVCLLNTSIAISTGALLESQPISRVFLSSFRLMWPGYVFLTPFAALLAMLYVEVGMWTVFPFLVPFMAARQCLNLYTRRTRTYMDTVAMLGTMTMRYHPYTREHLEAVAMWSERIATKLRLSTKRTMSIRLAGVLHDVGKIGVGEIILDKPGKLSEEDWLLIKGHPVKGANILGKMKYFDQIVPWIMHHHERMDGRGYPSGLQGDEIPIEARILAVADSFHAMMSKERSYRTPMSLEEAKTKLRNGAGTQWDPEVIGAMIALLEAR